MATIRRRGEKYQARIQLKGHEAVAKSFSNKTDAEKWAMIVEAEMIRGVFIKRTDAERTPYPSCTSTFRRLPRRLAKR